MRSFSCGYPRRVPFGLNFKQFKIFTRPVNYRFFATNSSVDFSQFPIPTKLAVPITARSIKSIMTGHSFKNGGTGSQQSTILQNMSKLSGSEFRSFFENIDVVMFDCDGVLWMGDYVLPGADTLVKRLRTLGKRVFFLTNNSTKTRVEFTAKFNKLGFEATLEEVVSSSYLSALHLKELDFQKKVYSIGTRGLTGELEALGIESLPIGPDNIEDHGGSWLASEVIKTITLDPEVGAVIVGFDQHFNYKKMFIAASYLKNKDVHFIATNPDEQFPSRTADFVIPGTGSIVNAVKTAAGREPLVIGKPFPAMFDFIQRTFKVDANRTLMVGDRANTDILFGRNTNLWTLLVLSGVTKLKEVEKWNSSGTDEEKKCVPHFYLNEVNDLLTLMTDNGF